MAVVVNVLVVGGEGVVLGAGGYWGGQSSGYPGDCPPSTLAQSVSSQRILPSMATRLSPGSFFWLKLNESM